MDISKDSIRLEVPTSYDPEFDNDSRYYKANKPHVSLNQVSVKIPKRDYRFMKKVREYEESLNDIPSD